MGGKFFCAPKISVVIPLYNCSTDSSRAEVEKLLPHFDGRLKILSTEKNLGGAGVPRNIGIEHAAGKYITFVDNDDFLLPTALADLYDAAEKFQADVVHTEKCFSFNDKGSATFEREELSSQKCDTCDFVEEPTLEPELDERIKRYVKGCFFWLPWGKLFRRDLIVNNRIDFPQMKTSDDMVFCFKCLCLAKNYLRVPAVTNIYRILKNSTSKKILTPREGIKFLLNVMTIGIASIDDFMSGLEFFSANPAARRDVLKFFIDMHFSFMQNLFTSNQAHEVLQIFYDELQNPALNQHGKDLVMAHLLAECVESLKA